MLKIASDVQAGVITERASKPKFPPRSAPTTEAFVPSRRLLPWDDFIASLGKDRAHTTREHVRWCIRTAVRNCETLRRMGGRALTLSGGGRMRTYGSNGDGDGGGWIDYEHRPDKLVNSARYLVELEHNLELLGCPLWAIPVAKRLVRHKLWQIWGV